MFLGTPKYLSDFLLGTIFSTILLLTFSFHLLKAFFKFDFMDYKHSYKDWEEGRLFWNSIESNKYEENYISEDCKILNLFYR